MRFEYVPGKVVSWDVSRSAKSTTSFHSSEYDYGDKECDFDTRKDIVDYDATLSGHAVRHDNQTQSPDGDPNDFPTRRHLA